ncbi:thiamine diphosphokinase [uncultured Clostridium sp.]|uniref:thiamine diphosphokinase n=1 Tax=uncultured Clostridium sp. TaxID=59620 RepID=UPI00260279D2|nr:thiamine diphosphokinase [uncultured Clostridium sp.]
MNILIVTGGTEPSEELLLRYKNQVSYIIGADKGCNVLYKYEIEPNLIVGDFDSGSLEAIEYFKRKGVEVRRFNSDKDYTDTHLAYNIAKEMKEVKKIFLLGATGTRVDHFLGNIGLFLNSEEDNVELEIIDNNNIMFMGKSGDKIKKTEGKILSFHALSEVVEKFSIKGAKYELEEYDLKLLEPRAISNEFLDEDVQITFEKGRLLVILSND